MAKSAQEYIDELYNKGMGTLGSSRDQRVQNDNQLIDQINAAIDTTTAAATKPYQAQIEQLPAAYQELYDANAVQELVGRRQVQEAMANMGLTDSGLNRTQQTALSVQRGNADAAARLEQQQKTQALQDQIAQLIASGEAQKQQQAASIRNNTANWYNDAANTVYNNAAQLGYNQYNTDVTREYEQEQARLNREAQIKAAQYEAQAAQAEAQAKAQQQAYDNQLSIFKVLMDAGMSYNEAYQRAFGTTAPNSAGSSAGSVITDALRAGATAAANAVNGAASGSGTSASYPRPSAMQYADMMKKELQNGKNDYYVVNQIVKMYPDNAQMQALVADMAGVSEAYQEYLKR